MDGGELDLPTGVSVTPSASGIAVDMYNSYNSASDGSNYAYSVLKDVNITFDNAKQFLVLVQAKDQGESN